MTFTFFIPYSTLNHLEEEDEGEADQEDRGRPGDDVEDGPVRVSHHQLFVVDEQEDEDEDKGEDDPVNHL